MLYISPRQAKQQHLMAEAGRKNTRWGNNSTSTAAGRERRHKGTHGTPEETAAKLWSLSRLPSLP